MKKKSTIFYLMIVSMFIRLFWLVIFEPHGAKKAAAKTQQMGELLKLASATIPYVVYPSIIILISIIVFSILKKKTAYLAGSIFGFVHLILISTLLIMRVSPGMGFLVVVPSSLGMMVFSYICYKEN